MAPDRTRKRRPPQAKATSARRDLARRGRAAVQKAKPPEYGLMVTAALALLAIGIVMVFSASSVSMVLGQSGDEFFFLKRMLPAVGIGLLVFWIATRVGGQVVYGIAGALLAVAIFLSLITLIPGIGTESNGARRWLGADPFMFQPAELTKVALVIFAARLISQRPKMLDNFGEMMPLLIATGLACGAIAIADLDTGAMLGVIVLMMMFAAGMSVRFLPIFAGSALGLFLVGALISPERISRITSFFSYGADPLGADHQVTQAKIAFASGGLMGVGPGHGVQKANYLAEAHTDMIAAVIGEEWGLAGMFIIVTLFAMIAFAGLRIAQRADDPFGKLLAIGLTSLLVVQALVNLWGVLRLTPTTGVPLPLVSYGNTSLLASLLAIGLILNVAIGGTSKLGRKPRPRRGTSGGGARLRVVDGGASARQQQTGKRSTSSGDRSRRHGRAPGAGTGRSRRA